MFLTDLDTRDIGNGLSILIAELHYRIPGTESIIAVPIGFETDFASIPQGFRWLITWQDNTRKPSVVHDYLYRRKIGTREWADKIFLLGMKDAGVSAWKRWLCYSAVRTFGWAAR
jgi:uncharacterized protein Usg